MEAWSGLRPTAPPPSAPTHAARARTSARSPMPQLSRERAVGTCTARPQVRRSAGRWQRPGPASTVAPRPPVERVEPVQAEGEVGGERGRPRRRRCRPRAPGAPGRASGVTTPGAGHDDRRGPGGGPSWSAAAAHRREEPGAAGRVGGPPPLGGVEPAVVDAPPVGGHVACRAVAPSGATARSRGPCRSGPCTKAAQRGGVHGRAGALVHPRRGHHGVVEVGVGGHHHVRDRPGPRGGCACAAGRSGRCWIRMSPASRIPTWIGLGIGAVWHPGHGRAGLVGARGGGSEVYRTVALPRTWTRNCGSRASRRMGPQPVPSGPRWYPRSTRRTRPSEQGEQRRRPQWSGVAAPGAA